MPSFLDRGRIVAPPGYSRRTTLLFRRAWVGVPLVWGVSQTVLGSLPLFRWPRRSERLSPRGMVEV
jgi:hypothetical protein